MTSRPTLRDLAKAEKAKQASKMAKSKAAALVAETSERSAAREESPAGVGEEAAVVVATTPMADPTQPPIQGDDEPAEVERQLKRKRSLTAEEKGKGKALSKKKKKKNRHETPTLPDAAIAGAQLTGESPFPNDLYDDSSVAATLLAKVTYPGERFPIPGLLLNSDLYKEFASRQMKALAHCNRMVIAYDQEARSRQLFIDEARKKEEAEKVRIAEDMSKLSAELESAKRSSDTTFKHLQAATVDKKKAEERLAAVERELATMQESREHEIAHARQTAVAEIQARLDRGYEYFSEMMGKPMTSLLYLSQAVANTQILDDLEDPAGGFDPIAERAYLEKSKAKLAGADAAFDAMAVELKKILGKDYHLSVKVGDLVCSPRLETVAKSIGIFTASGSNDGSMGLRLRDASEERSEADEDEADRVDEAATNEEEVAPGPQSERAITDPAADPVIEKPTGEAASSTALATQGEKQDKEPGEI